MWGWGGRRQDRQVSRLMALLQLAHMVFELCFLSYIYLVGYFCCKLDLETENQFT